VPQERRPGPEADVDREPWAAFFDSHYLLTYIPLLPDDRSRTEALDAVRLAGVTPGSSILDVPCGFGRHAVALAREGYRVVGLDRSITQIGEACRRRGAAREPALLQADYRHIPLVRGAFHAALLLHSSLGYGGDDMDRRVLKEIRRVLGPGGRLIVETNHRDRLPPRSPWREWYPLGDRAFLLKESRVDRVTGIVEMTHTYLPVGGAPEARTIRWRAYSATELVRLVTEAGFTAVSCYGSLRGEPFAPTTRLVVVATASGSA
jgi:SAM-dependent methyltransferase